MRSERQREKSSQQLFAVTLLYHVVNDRLDNKQSLSLGYPPIDCIDHSWNENALIVGKGEREC